MKNLICIFIMLFALVSCMDREVQLPHTTNNDYNEIVDVSPVYMFYDESKQDSVDFNRRNMISTTNWLVNIDKRLTIKQILPHLIYMYEKRHGDGMHTNESAKNYFTCFNPEIQNLAFIEFTDIIYTEGWSGDNLDPSMIYLQVDADGKLGPFTDATLRFDSFGAFYNETKNELNEDQIMNIQFVLDANLTIQKYIDLKTELLELKNMAMVISENEFIIN